MKIFEVVRLLAAVSTVACLTEEKKKDEFSIVKLPAQFHFEDIGVVATGVATGHIRTEISLKTMEKMQQELQDYQNKKFKPFMKKLYAPIQESYKHRVRAIYRSVDTSRANIRSATVPFRKLHNDKVKIITTSNQRRSVVSGVGMFLSFLGFGMSAYNSVQISQIQRVEKKEMTAIKELTVSVKETDRAAQTNAKNVEKLTKSMIRTEKTIGLVHSEHVAEKVVAEFEGIADRWQTSTRWWSAGMKQLLQHRLDPSLLDSRKMKAAVVEVERLAQKKGKVLLTDSVESLLNAKFSWWYNATEDSIVIVLHIDVVNHEGLSAYRWLKVPFFMGATEVVTLSDPKGNVIMVDGTGVVGEVMSKERLNECMQVGNAFVCEESGILRKDIEKSCIGAALRGNMAASLERCDIERLPNQTVRKY